MTPHAKQRVERAVRLDRPVRTTDGVSQRRLWPFVILAGAVLLVLAVRLRLAGLPLERDEGEYAYVGQLMLQGVPPYVAAYSMKLPGTYAVYAAVMALAGQTPTAIRLGLLAINLATMLLIFLLGRRLVDASMGAIAAAAYGVMSFGISVMGFAAHATHFVVLFAVAGLLVLHQALDSEKPWRLAASGALLGVAFVMKQHGILFALFGAAWLLARDLGRPRVTRRVAAQRLAVFVGGAAVPVAAVLVAIAAAGVFRKFWFWNVVYAADYATGSTLTQGMDNLVYQLGHMRPLSGFAVLAGIGFLSAFRGDDAQRRVPYLGGLLVLSAAAVAPGLYFRDHYFIQLLPAVALLIGLAVTTLARRFGRAAAVVLFLVAAAIAVGSEQAHYFRMSPVAFCRAVYGSNPFPEAVDVAAHVKELTRAGDRVAVLGSEPEIYFASGRRAATGHIYMYGLMEDQPHSLAMQKELESEIEAAAPAVVVVVNVSLSWILRAGSENDVFRWAESFLADHYEQVGSVQILEGGSKAAWSGPGASEIPGSENYLLVYRRKGVEF